MRLDHVQVAAPPGCEPQAREFYGDLLGMREVPKPAGVATGGAWFALDGGGEIHIGVEESFVPARKAHPAVAVEDVDAVASRLAAAGVMPQWDDRIAGVRRFYVLDPFGNRIEIRSAA